MSEDSIPSLSDFLSTIAFRMVTLLVNAYVIETSAKLAQPLVPEVSWRNAVGISLFLWIVSTELRGNVNIRLEKRT